MTPLIGGLISAGLKIIEKVIPDPAAKQEAQYKLMELAQRGELAELEADVKLALGQLDVNKVEAGSPSLFKSGWRPSVGWVCTLGLFYQFLLQPLLVWTSGIYLFSPPPTLNIVDLLTLLFGMLGLGAYRTYEKKQGITS